MKETTRRNFIKSLAFNFATLTGYLPLLAGCKPNRLDLPTRSKIVRVTNPDATDNTGGRNNDNLTTRVIKQMVDNGIKAFTGKKSVKASWEAIIPDINKKIAIKVNCQITSIYTKAKVVKAVTDGLVERGVSPDKIIIYDLTDNAFQLAGFRKNLGAGIKIGTNAELGGYSWYSYFGIPIRGFGRRFCKILAGQGKYGCDYLINIPVQKALDGYSGVTISMKNHFGSISNCGRLHPTIQDSIAALNAHKLIVEKTRLILVDGIFTEYKWVNGRDQKYVETTNQLLLGTDPVAIDYLGWKTIERLRQKHSLKPIQPEPAFIQKAALHYGLGNNDRKKIGLIDI